MNRIHKKAARILMTADTVGGVWTYSIELARALQEHSIETVLATMGAPISKEQRLDLQSLERVRVFESTYKLEWMENPWRDIDAAGRWLLAVEDRNQPDVVHLNQYAFGTLPWKSPTLIAAHSCVLSWWAGVHGTHAPQSWNHYKSVVSRGLMKADAVVAPSNFMRRELADHYGRSRVTVIHNGHDSSKFKQGPKRKFILSAGRLWDSAKNISMIAGLASSLPWPVYLAGEDGGHNIQCRNIRYLGKLGSRSLRKLFASASIYVMPAKYEPFGLSILEAALSGCALILGDIRSLRELWDQAAIFVNPDKPEELKEAVDSLAENPSLLTMYSDAAFKRAEKYSTQKMSTEYLRLYHSLLLNKADVILPQSTENKQPYFIAR